MKKNILIFSVVLLIIALIICTSFYIIDTNRMNNNEPVLFSTWGKDYNLPVDDGKKDIKNENIKIILSLEDNIEDNSAWCGTFNLIWNDLKNELAKTDIVFTPQTKVVENLNKTTFNTSHLSEDSYYKIYGRPSLELKSKIEKDIKEKFNEKSNILEDFNWQNDGLDRYFLYAMLKKEFEFENEFTELKLQDFGKYKNVKYFGIDEKTDKIVRNQVKVLYYNSKDDFAIKLLTKNNDEVIISKGEDKDNFYEMYQEIITRSKNYDGETYFLNNDKLKIPCISFNLKEQIKEVENKSFKFDNGREYTIEKALQTIEFSLDKKGGKVKSEAGMMVKDNSIVIDSNIPREFYVDDTFSIFLIEKEKKLPYLAAKISDITCVQK